jgi:hypothetical protein
MNSASEAEDVKWKRMCFRGHNVFWGVAEEKTQKSKKLRRVNVS